MKLRNRKSHLMTLPEGQPPNNIRPKITQWLYFLALFSITAYLLFLGFQRFVIFTGWGQVEVEKTQISTSRGGRIKTLAVKEGQLLKKHDLIAELMASRTCIQGRDVQLEKLTYQIMLNKSRLRVMRQKLSDMRQREKQSTLRRALELSRSQSPERSARERERKKLEEEVHILAKEIKLQHKLARDIESKENHAGLPAECQNETIVSPFPARVLAVRRKANEFANRGETIVTLVPEDAVVSVEAYFENKMFEYLTVGKHIDLEFPDGWKSSGRIATVKASGYAIPDRDWNGDIPRESEVRVHLLPLNHADGARWLLYDRLNVRVRGKK